MIHKLDMLSTDKDKDWHPDKHKIFTPDGFLEVPVWKVYRFAQPVMMRHTDWGAIISERPHYLFPWFVRIRLPWLRLFTFGKRQHWVRSSVYVYDAARIFLGEQTHNATIDDFTEENKDWWVEASVTRIKVKPANPAKTGKPKKDILPEDYWEETGFCGTSCQTHNVAEMLAEVKQAHQTPWYDQHVSWNEYDLHQSDFVPTGYPLQAIAQELNMKVLPCIGLGLSHFMKYDQNWREWMVDEGWDEDMIPTGEPVVSKISYEMDELKARFVGCVVKFSVDGLSVSSHAIRD